MVMKIVMKGARFLLGLNSDCNCLESKQYQYIVLGI